MPVPASEGSRVVLDGNNLSLGRACAVARRRVSVEVARPARERVRAARAQVERTVARDAAVYGLNTGFGRLANTRIEKTRLTELQRNLLFSHAVGVGPEAPPEVVRLMLLLRLNALLRGHSGVREETIDLLQGMLAKDVLPVIPEQGSVGASGDLAPLAHLALVLIGEGEARLGGGDRMHGGEALSRAGLRPIALEAKEGLALINGTQFSAALGLLAVERARALAVLADVACAASLEGIRGSVRPFDARIAGLRPHPGHAEVADNVRRLMNGSQILKSHENCDRVQDQYSVRCAPQVHGAVRDALAHVAVVLDREINSVTDNPLLFPDDDEVISGGNFHAEPLALPFDYAAIAVAELGSISERRIETLVNPDLSGLPPFLAGGSAGLDSGLMILQVTAAALVSENKSLAHPASVDSIPTSANKEDHVSMAPIAARHLRDIASNVECVLGLELVAARFALHFHQPLLAGAGVQAAFERLAAVVPPPSSDRWFKKDIDATLALIRDGAIVAAAESAAGGLRWPCEPSWEKS
jgi:histidine ammonia-lyase